MLHQVILCASHIKKTVTVSDVRKKVLRLPGRGSIPDERAAALVQPLLRLINESVAMDGRMAGAYKAMVADLKTCLQAQVGCMDLRLKQEEAACTGWSRTPQTTRRGCMHRMESHALLTRTHIGAALPCSLTHPQNAQLQASIEATAWGRKHLLWYHEKYHELRATMTEREGELAVAEGELADVLAKLAVAEAKLAVAEARLPSPGSPGGSGGSGGSPGGSGGSPGGSGGSPGGSGGSPGGSGGAGCSGSPGGSGSSGGSEGAGFSGGAADPHCPICYGPFDMDDPMSDACPRVLLCGHPFCKRCLDSMPDQLVDHEGYPIYRCCFRCEGGRHLPASESVYFHM